MKFFNKIQLRDWIISHPDCFRSSTDFAYVKVANDLLKVIRHSVLGDDLDDFDKHQLALALTLYFEDVVSEIGLWNAFVVKHKELYDKYLPFYDIDEEEYHIGEVNEEDIRFLIWSHLMDMGDGRFYNPENPDIMMLAQQVFVFLDKKFETTPINEEFKEFLYDAKKLEDFYFVKTVLIWMTREAYLLKSSITDYYMEEYIEQYAETFKEWDDSKFSYMLSSERAISVKVGPLALLPKEWFSIMCRKEGLDECAKDIMEISLNPLHIFSVEDHDADKLYIKGADEKLITLSKDCFNDLSPDVLEENKCLISSLVNYKGSWNINGMATWNKDVKGIEQDRERLQKNKTKEIETFADMIKDNGNSPMFYFKNTDDMMKCFGKYAKISESFKLPKESEEWENIAVLVESDADFSIAPGKAVAIKDKRNPYYNAKVASSKALGILADADNISREMIHYLLEHKLLPDACVNSLHGPERGRQLVQENIDFIARFMRRERY